MKMSNGFQKQRNWESLDKQNDTINKVLNQNLENLKHKKIKTKQKKIKYSDCDDYEDDQNYEGLPKWKLLLVIGSIFLCFALLFPIVFSPLLNSLFGRNKSKNNKQTLRQDARSPPLSGRPQAPPSRNGLPLHYPHMRMPHVETGTTQQSSGRGGMISWMMPFYTVGVVIFLGYTLYKIMFKKTKKQKSRHLNDKYFDESDSELRVGELGRKKMHIVQKRLQKTEKTMRQILEQLEKIAQTTDINNDVSVNNQNSNEKNNVMDTKNNQINLNNKDSIQLNEEQVLQVEKGLRELKELSEIYKIQQNNASELDSECVDESDNFERSATSFSCSSETKSDNSIEENSKIDDEKNEEYVKDVVTDNNQILNDTCDINDKSINDNHKKKCAKMLENKNLITNTSIKENLKPIFITNKNKDKFKNIRRRTRRE